MINPVKSISVTNCLNILLMIYLLLPCLQNYQNNAEGRNLYHKKVLGIYTGTYYPLYRLYF